jgi:hypothetical protein
VEAEGIVGHSWTKKTERRSFYQMSTPHKQFRRRLGRLEVSLGMRSQCTETPLYVRVRLEAQQELAPEDLLLLQSAEAAQGEGRFRSLEEDAVMKKFWELRDVVARRYGFFGYGQVLGEAIGSRSPKRGQGHRADDAPVAKILEWGRRNRVHLYALKAQKAPESNSSNR